MAVFIAAILVLLGLFPIIGGVLQQMPKPVLGGATLIMFGTVAMAGVKIIAESGLDRRAMFITAISIGMGLGVDFVPEVLSSMPDQMKNIIGNPLTIGAFCSYLPEYYFAGRPGCRGIRSSG